MTGNDPDGTSKRTVRYYTAEYMEEFLRHLIKKYNYKAIYFDDDTFNLGTKHTLAMCELLGLGIVGLAAESDPAGRCQASDAGYTRGCRDGARYRTCSVN